MFYGLCMGIAPHRSNMSGTHAGLDFSRFSLRHRWNTQRSVITQWLLLFYNMTCASVYDKITGHTKFPLTAVLVHSSVPWTFAFITLPVPLVVLQLQVVCDSKTVEEVKQLKGELLTPFFKPVPVFVLIFFIIKLYGIVEFFKVISLYFGGHPSSMWT